MWSGALWCRHVVVAGEECWGFELGAPCAAGEEDASGGVDCVPCVWGWDPAAGMEGAEEGALGEVERV
jgi:hypothetical protein